MYHSHFNPLERTQIVSLISNVIVCQDTAKHTVHLQSPTERLLIQVHVIILTRCRPPYLGHSGPIPGSFEHSCRWLRGSPGTARHSRASHCHRCRSSDRAGYNIWSWMGYLCQTGTETDRFDTGYSHFNCVRV